MKKKIYLICDRRNNSLAQELLQGNTYYIVSMRNLAIRYNKERSLIIALIDNESYGSTGSQETYASQVNLSDIAKAFLSFSYSFLKQYYHIFFYYSTFFTLKTLLTPKDKNDILKSEQ